MKASLVSHVGDLSSTGLVYVKRNVRNSKVDHLVDEAELLQANQHYACHTGLTVSTAQQTHSDITVPHSDISDDGSSQAPSQQSPIALSSLPC